MLVIPLSPSLDVWIIDDDLSIDGPHRALAIAYPTTETIEELEAIDAKILIATKSRPVWYDEGDVTFDAGEAHRLATIRRKNEESA